MQDSMPISTLNNFVIKVDKTRKEEQLAIEP